MYININRNAIQKISIVLLAGALAFPAGAEPPPFGQEATLPAPRLAGETPPPPGMAENPRERSLSGSFLSGYVAGSAGDSESAMRYLEQVVAEDPGNTALAGQLMLLKIMAGQMQQAVELARSMEHAPDRELIVDLLLAMEQARLGQFRVAEEHLRHAESVSGESVWLPLFQAWLNAGQGKLQHPPEAIDFIQDTSKIPSFLYYHLALINDFAGFVEAARKQYELAVLDIAHAPYRAVESFADFYRRRNMPDERAALLARYAEARPEALSLIEAPDMEEASIITRSVDSVQEGLAEILFTMAGVLYSVDQGYDSLVYLQLATHLRPDFPSAWLMLGNTLELGGSYARASRAYSMVSAESPLYQRALLRKAFILDKQGDTAQSLRMLDALAEKHPELSEPYIAKGDLLRSKSRFKEAEAAYTDALERIAALSPSHWALLFARGACRERIGRFADAEQDFLKALELYPDQPEVLNYLGYMWLVMDQRIPEAAEMIQKAYEQRPDQPHIIDSMGWMLYRTGRIEEAVTLLEQAIALMPADPSVNEHLGDAYWHSGRKNEARFQWERSLTYTQDETVKRALQNKIKDGLPTYRFVQLPEGSGSFELTAPSPPAAEILDTP